MIVLPGDTAPPSKHYGPGILNQQILVAGDLQSKHGIPYVDTNFRRYQPALRDLVIGTITMRGADFYKVSLQNFSKPVRLSHLSFENATKKNKPNLKVGDVVYGKVVFHHRDLETEIECFDSKTGKSAGFGQLKDGNTVEIGCGFARKLIYQQNDFLENLGNRFAFDAAVGMNGKIWIKGTDLKTTLEVCKLIKEEDKRLST